MGRREVLNDTTPGRPVRWLRGSQDGIGHTTLGGTHVEDIAEHKVSSDRLDLVVDSTCLTNCSSLFGAKSVKPSA
jgi:hypothetical protein